MIKTSIAIFFLTLGGCTQDLRDYSVLDGCSDFGFAKGTPEYRDCRAEEDRERAKFRAELEGIMHSPEMPSADAAGLSKALAGSFHEH